MIYDGRGHVRRRTRRAVEKRFTKRREGSRGDRISLVLLSTVPSHLRCSEQSSPRCWARYPVCNAPRSGHNRDSTGLSRHSIGVNVRFSLPERRRIFSSRWRESTRGNLTNLMATEFYLCDSVLRVFYDFTATHARR